jgi:hypothetical protein
MPQTLAEEQHDPPWRNQTDTYSRFKKNCHRSWHVCLSWSCQHNQHPRNSPEKLCD